MNPVMLPPGRERLSTKPAATGSETSTNTIGTVRVAGCNAPTIGVAVAKMTSGARAANSAAYLRISSALPAVQRVSMRTLRRSNGSRRLAGLVCLIRSGTKQDPPRSVLSESEGTAGGIEMFRH